MATNFKEVIRILNRTSKAESKITSDETKKLLFAKNELEAIKNKPNYPAVIFSAACLLEIGLAKNYPQNSFLFYSLFFFTLILTTTQIFKKFLIQGTLNDINKAIEKTDL